MTQRIVIVITKNVLRINILFESVYLRIILSIVRIDNKALLDIRRHAVHVNFRPWDPTLLCH